MVVCVCVLFVSFESSGFAFGNSLLLFFQAEDGIRDLVRSRGLGDVYKRQVRDQSPYDARQSTAASAAGTATAVGLVNQGDIASVSYTHLTLPTSDLV